MKKYFLKTTGILIISIILFASCTKIPKATSFRLIAELNIGESQDIKLSNGEIVKLALLEITEVRDSLRNAIRAASIKVSVDGEVITLSTGNYNLPVVVGKVQIDCPAIKSYFVSEDDNPWKLTRDARFRLWSKGSPYIEPGTFVYPIKQAWLASMSQSGNEPTYVDWGENPANKNIYYHAGHDIGGAEGMDEIVSSTDGLVISANNEILPGYNSIPVYVHTDAVSVIDDRGWLLGYVHLDSTDPAIKPGIRIKMGQKIGYIGKQGSSGGWVHLHFSIFTKESPSGKWGIEDAYAYAWESYIQKYKPALIAVARPHHLAWTGQEITLDGRRSKSLDSEIVSFEWIFTDGTTASGAVQKKFYLKAGEFSEILKVTDSKGNVDYDFTVVQVYSKPGTEKTIPAIQAAYHPTLNIKPGDPVTFLVRTFNTAVGNEVWDFGDGSPHVMVKSETVNRETRTKGRFAETIHKYSKSGHYVITVERTDEAGIKATAHLHAVVKE
jgi:murein DD-endopeptidase MepM/ murein hydrolase activator NlpD